MLVVIYHVQLGRVANQDFDSLFGFVKHGAAGVDAFFVISGFIITLTVLRKPDFDIKSFALNGFFRIYPTYWVVLTVAVGLGYASYRLTGQSTTYDITNPASVLVSYLLLPIQTQIFPVAWTLTLEMAFYIIFCLSYSTYGLRGVIISLLVWYVMARFYGFYFTPNETNIIWLFHSIVLEFLFGVLIAALWINGKIRMARGALALGIMSYAAAVGGLFEWTELGREFKYGIPAAILVYGIVGIRWKAPRLAVLAGDSSYILYLIHPLVISTVTVITTRLFGLHPATHNGLTILILLAAIILSLALTVLIERPYILWYKAFIQRYGARGVRKPKTES